MPIKTGTSKKELAELGVVKLEHTEAHLQDEVILDKCYICSKAQDENMVLLRTRDKQLGLSCLSHPGVLQEFLRQFKRPPLGYKQYILK